MTPLWPCVPDTGAVAVVPVVFAIVCRTADATPQMWGGQLWALRSGVCRAASLRARPPQPDSPSQCPGVWLHPYSPSVSQGQITGEATQKGWSPGDNHQCAGQEPQSSQLHIPPRILQFLGWGAAPKCWLMGQTAKPGGGWRGQKASEKAWCGEAQWPRVWSDLVRGVCWRAWPRAPKGREDRLVANPTW